MKIGLKARVTAILLAAAMSAAGCSSAESSSAAETSAPEITTTAAPVTTAATTTTVSSEVTTVSEVSRPVIPDPIEVYGYTETGHKGVKKLNFPDEVFTGIHIRDGIILVENYSDSYDVKLITAADGALVAQKHFDGPGNSVMPFDGGYYAFDLHSNFEILDYSLSTVKKFTVPDKDVFLPSLSSDGRYVLYNTPDIEGSQLYDIEEGKKIPLTRNVDLSEFAYYSTEGGYFVVNDTSKSLAAFLVYTDGTVKLFTNSYQSYVIRDTCCDAVSDGLIYNTLGDSKFNLIKGIDSEQEVMEVRNDIMYLSGVGNMTFLRMSDGTSTEPMDELSPYMMEADSDGTVVFSVSDNERPSLYVADPSMMDFTVKHEISGNYTPPEDYEYNFEMPKLTGEAKALLDKIYDKYNVRVFFDLSDGRTHAAFDDEYDYYSYDSDGQLDHLRYIEDFLSLWPEGICSEITDYGVECWIFVCGRIELGGGNTTGVDPAGVQFDLDMHPTIALESYDYEGGGYNFTENLSHEFIHMLDSGIDSERLDKWKELSPEDGYFDVYTDYDSGSDKYTYFGEYYSDPDNVYYIDNYSKVNLLEDRARVGQYLWTSYTLESLDSVFEAPHIKAKAEHLCKEYRERYKSLEKIKKGDLYLEKYLDAAA